ncbi:hypothetical protein OG897_30150 [Streptomyces sp. NBC_00237]|nr:hypothetical protein [Streptomyces sp. NBC_00237]
MRGRTRPVPQAAPGIGTLVGEVHVGGGLDGLGVQHAGRRRFAVASFALADQASQQAGEFFEHAVLLLLAKWPFALAHGAKSYGR